MKKIFYKRGGVRTFKGVYSGGDYENRYCQ